ncbi:MAG: citryl-CoA lyase [Methanobrevibacter sp.]|nr:citryl-CoA lyase [Methanobrevibacter sp.]
MKDKKSLDEIFKLKEHKMRTSITKVESNKIITKGYSQEDLINNLSFPEMVFLLFKKELPSEKELKIFNHILVSFCDHGLTPPSTQVARLITSSGSPLNVALSGALLSFGVNHAGAIEKIMDLLQDRLNNKKEITDEQIDEIAINIVNEYKDKKMNVPGYGHRFHEYDPRAKKILELATEEGFVSNHTKLALSIEKHLKNKKIRLNIDGMNGAILSDLGFKGINGIGLFIIGRLPGLIAHINEERDNENIFRKLYELEDIPYIGDEDKVL